MKRLVLFICLMAVAFGVRAATQYRDFTSADGKTIKAAVKAYDAQKKIVTIERDNRKTSKVPITVFSEADQEYIERWNNLSGIRSPSKFPISCDRRAIKNWTEKQMGTINYSDGSSEKNQVTGKTHFKETGYEIVFANRNNYAVTDLILEYCIYYEQETQPNRAAEQGIIFGSVKMEKLTSGERKKIQTTSVVTFKDENNASFLNARVLKGEVFGIAMRLYLQEGDEKTLIREEAIPDSIPNSHAWSSESRPAGLNK